MKSLLSFQNGVHEPYLIVGLGNPGSFYEKTRHNIGLRAVSYFARKHSILLDKKLFKGSVRWGQGIVCHHSVNLILPLACFMNESGQMVKKSLFRFKIPLKRSIIVVDDIALPFGKLRLKEKGSHGGHNGLRDIGNSLNSFNYPRLRLGVGKPEQGAPLDSYVLGIFNGAEEELLPLIFDKVVTVLTCWIEKGVSQAATIANAAST